MSNNDYATGFTLDDVAAIAHDQYVNSPFIFTGLEDRLFEWFCDTCRPELLAQVDRSEVRDAFMRGWAAGGKRKPMIHAMRGNSNGKR